MAHTHKLGVFIHRRDIRIEDNTALNKSLRECDQVIPIFIFNQNQCDKNKNPYFGEHSFSFLIKSLQELETHYSSHKSQLHFFLGNPLEVLQTLHKSIHFDALYWNCDYTPFSVKRDADIESWAHENKIAVVSCHDACLVTPGSVLKGDGTPYTVYTPFYKSASQHTVNEPQQLTRRTLYSNAFQTNHSTTLTTIIKRFIPNHEQVQLRLLTKGGRQEALSLLNDALKLTDYKTVRDFPSIKGTSYLSSHHKFGTISMREHFHAVIKVFPADSQYVKELYWRDFYYHIAHHFPHVFGKEFQAQYQMLEWSQNEALFQKWCEGKTGFPIVDAGMRQLNQTGYMHNRVRMIVASFLTKDLHLDWRLGERYFAQKLTDYDPCVNNGSWQWAASTGCDAQPYFRIFNPWLQQKRFDSDCEYIKTWVNELKDVDNDLIHDEDVPKGNYIQPIVVHKDEKDRAIAMFKR